MAKDDKFYYDNFAECTALAKKAANYLVECLENYDADRLYLATMHDLTKNSTDVLTTLPRHKIYDCLEACSDACEHVSECVGSIVMKNT